MPSSKPDQIPENIWFGVVEGSMHLLATIPAVAFPKTEVHQNPPQYQISDVQRGLPRGPETRTNFKLGDLITRFSAFVGAALSSISHILFLVACSLFEVRPREGLTDSAPIPTCSFHVAQGNAKASPKWEISIDQRPISILDTLGTRPELSIGGDPLLGVRWRDCPTHP